jgi:hypothetical protein
MPGPTAGFQAGIESNDVTWSLAQEVTWGVSPTGPYSALRTTGGESMQLQEQTARPTEVNELAEAAAEETTSVSAGGSIPIALSFGTYDELFSGLLRSDWGTPLAIDGVAGDIQAVASGNKLTSATAGKFANAAVGQWIRLSGFPLNNGVYRIAAKASALEITLAGRTLVNETPTGSNAKIRGRSLVNARMFKSYTLRKKLGALGYQQYPGSIITGAPLRMSLGDFLTGSLTFLSKGEVKSLVDIASSLVPAPAGVVHNNVKGFGGLFLDGGTKVQATMRSLNVNISLEGAAADYGMGSEDAQGMRQGTFTAGMEAEMYFPSWDLYDRARSSLGGGEVTGVTMDARGNAYAFTLLNGKARNPRIVAGRPGEPVLASFSFSGNPRDIGGTLQIDAMAAA